MLVFERRPLNLRGGPTLADVEGTIHADEGARLARWWRPGLERRGFLLCRESSIFCLTYSNHLQ